MASILKWVKKSIRRAPPMRFLNTGFKTIHTSDVLEEDKFPDFNTGQYYPVNIGEIFNSKYQVVGKLGFGVTSTVWLGRDLIEHQHVSLKAYKRQGANWEEFDTYKRLNQGNSSHPGHGHMRKALGIFTIPLVGGDHYCLVQKPTWESFRDLLHRNPSHRFTKELGRILRRWLGYWANLLRVSSNAGLGATNFLRIMGHGKPRWTYHKIRAWSGLRSFWRGRIKRFFLVFMRGMLQWRPEDRKTAKESLEDPWLNYQIG